ncbi:MAG: DciA family protein [Pseudomonadota bacterium]
MAPQTPKRIPQTRGRFMQAGGFVSKRIRAAGEKRGFAETRLLTHWAEICGPELAALTVPVKVSYARQGFGGTLILSCEGARALEVQMQAEVIRTRVNACYGYNAIRRISLTQTDSAGFAEAQARFAGPEVRQPTAPAPVPEAVARQTEGVQSEALRLALGRLGTNITSRKTV